MSSKKSGRICPTCEDGDLVIKHSRYGRFIGCANYPDCKHTERYLERMGLICPQCGEADNGEIVQQRSRKGRTFYGCSRYPDCDYTVWRLPRDLKRLEEKSPDEQQQSAQKLAEPALPERSQNAPNPEDHSFADTAQERSFK